MIAGGSLAQLAAEQRLVVFVGEGGVGKTSCAAAFAVAAAGIGRRVAVLTIDPAPRLGDALGLDTLGSVPTPIELPRDAIGSLVALRLDTKRTFDEIVERLAPSAEVARTILVNPIYRTISGSLGGSEAYMALQRLYQLDREADFDLIVVDTPPAVHAHELLSAPSRLAALVETDAVRVLANPTLVVARAGTAIAKTTAAILLPLLERITGFALRTSVSDFIREFESVLVGLVERATAVEELLARPSTSFIGVARPHAANIDATVALARSLADRGLPPAALVINRVTPPSHDRLEPREVRLAGAPAGAVTAVATMEQCLDARRALEAKALERARRVLACPIVAVTALDHDVASVADLLKLSEMLCAGALWQQAR